MKESIKKAICAATAALLMVIFTIAVTGCGEKEPERSKYRLPKNCDVVLEYEGSEQQEASVDFIEICNTYDEIQRALIDHGAGAWDNDEVRKYADEHVENKSFVVCFYKRNCDNGPHRLREIEVIDGTLTMYIWCSGGTIANDVMRDCIFIAGVDKSFVANVTECRYVFV